MKILGAIGLGIGILVMKALIPTVFSVGENTIITGLETTTQMFQKAQVVIDSFPK